MNNILNLLRSVLNSYVTLFLTTLLILGFFCACLDKKRPPKKSQVLVGDSIYALADSAYYKSQFKLALNQYKRATVGFALKSDTLGMAKSLNDTGLSFYRMGVMDSAQIYYNKALVLDSLQGDTTRIIGRLRNIGIVHYAEGNYILAIRYYAQSLELAERIGSEDNIAAINTSLGSIYQDQERYSLALLHYEESLREYIQLNRPIKIALAHDNIGIVYGALGNYKEALENHERALNMKKDQGNPGAIAHSLHNIGVLHQHMKEYALSEDYFVEAYKIRLDLKNPRKSALTANALGSLYLDWNKKEKALPYLQEAEYFYKEHDDIKNKLYNLKYWARYYEQSFQYRSAYETLRKWTRLNDSLFNTQKLQVLEAWSQFELKQKENDAIQQKQRADIQQAAAESRSQQLILALGALALVLGLLTLLFRQKRQIMSLNKDLDLLNTDIRHRKGNDYQRVLTVLGKMGFSDVGSIANMLYASMAVDDSLYETPGKRVNLKIHLERVLKEKQTALNMKAQGMVLNSTVAPVVISGERTSKLTFIISELVTNSAKHANSTEAPKMTVQIVSKNGQLLVKYTDNCEEVSLEKLDSSKGMGWNIIKSFAKQLDSEISVRREQNLNIFSMVIAH